MATSPRVKDFLNALIKVRDTGETVTVGRFTFSDDGRERGMAGCRYSFCRPVVGDLNRPQESQGVGGFAFPCVSIVRLARSFAHDNADWDRRRQNLDRAYISDNIATVDAMISHEQSLLPCGYAREEDSIRFNIRRLNDVRDDLLAKLEAA